MKIRRMVLGPVETNCYIFCDEARGEAAVIDPAADHRSIIRAAEEAGCEIVKIILTHGHYDHIGGLRGLLDECKRAELYAHTKGAQVLGNMGISLCCEIGRKKETFVPDVTVSDGDVIPFGGSGFEVIYTPGHTIDSMCLKFENVVFCGDTVFRFSIGRTDLPTGDFNQEIKSIKTKILVLDDSTQLCPGHGEATTVGEERRYNPYLRD
ncbi:MAG TPA: MBL fold metallo-hydrolase [Candidatus Monoglobus merdigallinarum]|uniref:MBL fold metallo-hydrolase n=1 Tax=Candidatus Monoglobus merdigallinarum TaxID=2838698 RepID=A0A9D1PQW6_9FIRM|nr:MBL fold metallo-hydrolase [Candidatus Monoglobus merdigallinarum]